MRPATERGVTSEIKMEAKWTLDKKEKSEDEEMSRAGVDGVVGGIGTSLSARWRRDGAYAAGCEDSAAPWLPGCNYDRMLCD